MSGYLVAGRYHADDLTYKYTPPVHVGNPCVVYPLAAEVLLNSFLFSWRKSFFLILFVRLSNGKFCSCFGRCTGLYAEVILWIWLVATLWEHNFDLNL